MINSKYKHTFFITLIITLTLLLSACNTPIVLDPKGAIGAQEKSLIIDALLLMSIVVIPVIFLTLLFAWRYRATNTSAKYTPSWYHSQVLEGITWGIPIIIILVLGTITWHTTHELDPYKPIDVQEKPLVIEAVALDWKWLFIYPEQNIASVNFVEFPANVPISFKITADAPMNAFQIPQLGGQIYAMAGMQTRLHLIANTPGDYFGRAVNYSGRGFSGMQFVARATSVNDFKAWVNLVKHSPNVLSAEEYKQLALPSENNPITTYRSVQNHLFDNIIMQFMMPGMEDLSVDRSNMKM